MVMMLRSLEIDTNTNEHPRNQGIIMVCVYVDAPTRKGDKGEEGMMKKGWLFCTME